MSYGRAPLPSQSQMGSRLHIAGLPGDIREREIEKKFDRYGKVVEVTLKGNYCFLQYRSSDSARDAVREMNDAKAFGERISVQYAKNPKQFGGPGGGGGRGRDYDRRDRRSPPRSRGSNSSNRRRSPRGSPPRRSDFRLAVTNLSTRCSWQDLKSVMSKAGEVVFADAHKRTVGAGVVEFDSKRDMEKALTKLDGLEINGKPIKLEVEESKVRGGSRSSSRSSSGSGSSRSRSRSGSPKRKRSRKHSERSRGSRSRSSDKKSSEDEKEASDAENGDDGEEKNEEENENEQPDQKVSLGHLEEGEDGADAESEQAEHTVEARQEDGSGSDDEAGGQEEMNGDGEENNSEEEAQEEQEEEEESRDGAEEESFEEQTQEGGEKEEEEPEKPATRKRKSLRGQQS